MEGATTTPFDEGRVRLTHSIAGPVDVETLEYEEGGDRGLRVAYAGGQALLHVERPAG